MRVEYRAECVYIAKVALDKLRAFPGDLFHAVQTLRAGVDKVVSYDHAVAFF